MNLSNNYVINNESASVIVINRESAERAQKEYDNLFANIYGTKHCEGCNCDTR